MISTLLLTWTIRPSKKNISKSQNDLDFSIREKKYIDAIIYYITQSNFDNIIFCENSNYPFTIRQSIKRIANIYKKKVELLQFEWNPIYPEKYWYWCGEAEIIDYVIHNSKLIKETKSFYKITWRYIIWNINKIISKLENQENYFHKQWLFASPLWVSTVFFKISHWLYKKYLYKKTISFFHVFFSSWIDLKKITKYPHLSIEYVWYLLLRKYLLSEYIKQNNAKIRILQTYPILSNYWLGMPIRNIIYNTYIYLWFGEFNFFHKIIDFLLYKKKYSWIARLNKNFSNRNQ